MFKLRTLLILLACIGLIACQSVNVPFAYKIDIEQGNIVTDEMLGELEPGMTKQQVHAILGTPMLIDMFHQNRWDYYYYNKKGRHAPEYHDYVVLFDDAGKMVEYYKNPVELPS